MPRERVEGKGEFVTLRRMSFAGWWKARFGLTRQERMLVLAVLAIALVGLVARYVHLSRQEADVYAPPPVSEEDRL